MMMKKKMLLTMMNKKRGIQSNWMKESYKTKQNNIKRKEKSH